MRLYTGSFECVRNGMRASRALLMFAVAAVVLLCEIGYTSAISNAFLQQIVTDYRSKVFLLKMTLRAPLPGAARAPMLDEDGLHFYDPSGRIVLAAGTLVEVTGVFNYSERGFFLELASEATGIMPEELNRRRRIRIRFMTKSSEDELDEEATQIADLIDTILSLPPPPSLTPPED